MSIDNLEQLLVEELKDLYDAEKQITQALPGMIEKAKSADLRKALQEHLKRTEFHIQRLEQAFDEMGVKAHKKECKGMKALIKEGEDMLKETTNAITRDAAIIAAAQKVEHYEMAGYGTVVSFANQLNRNKVSDLLQQSLNEEKHADLSLSLIAEAKVNAQAV